MNSPIIFCHYGNSEYLPFVFQAARLTNPEKDIFLLGDSENKWLESATGIKHHYFTDFEFGIEIEIFEKVYKLVQGQYHNHIRAEKDWVNFVFKRWFYIANFIRSQNIHQFWHFDSDNMILVPLAAHEYKFEEYDCTEQCNGICINGYITSQQIVLNYINKINDLFQDHEFIHGQQNEFDEVNQNFAFTEMRAYDEFKKSEGENIKTIRLNTIIDGTSFDDCLCQEHDMEMEVYDADNITNQTLIKKVYCSENGDFYCYNITNRQLIRMNSLNLSWVPLEIFEIVLQQLKKKSNNLQNNQIQNIFQLPTLNDIKRLLKDHQNMTISEILQQANQCFREKYRNDTRIMMISGNNFQFGRNKTEYSYYFSRYSHIWGWASWRRSWLLFDNLMPNWPELRDNKWLFTVFNNQRVAEYWSHVFQIAYDGFDTWDFTWLFTLWFNNQLAILPNVNLVSNIGFGSGTHTTMKDSPFANMEMTAMKFPLFHPNFFQQYIEADNFTEYTQFSHVDLSIKLFHPLILIDGVFFQMYSTGIARVWRSLLEEWAKSDFANHLLVLDRGGNSMPRIDGIRYREIPRYDYGNTEADKQLLQEICNQENADLFISTYYTTPLETPSVFMGYDMIPEVMGADLSDPMWREKHYAIQHASSYITISANTAHDLSRFFTSIDRQKITIAHCGIDPSFVPASSLQVQEFKYKYGIQKPYFLLGNLTGYKNGILFFQAFQELINHHQFEIVCTGSGSRLPHEWRQYTAGCVVHQLYLSDEELRLAYAGAIALVYPSKYEGFGMPIVEAMACGCPVITTHNGSIPEVAGEAALYISDDDIVGLAEALCEVQKPRIRRSLIDAGLAQAHKFSWQKMAAIVQDKLLETAALKLPRTINYLICPNWQLSEEELGLDFALILQKFTPQNDRNITLIIDITGTTEEDANLFLSSVAMTLMIEEDLEMSENLNFSFIHDLSTPEWDELLPQILVRIQLDSEILPNSEAIESLPVLSARCPNYLICPDWHQPSDRLTEELSQRLIDLSQEDENEGACVLIDITDMDSETITLYLSELVMTVLLNEGIDLNDRLQISLIGDLSPDQWDSLKSLVTIVS